MLESAVIFPALGIYSCYDSVVLDNKFFELVDSAIKERDTTRVI